MSELALHRIREAKHKRLTSLDLGNCNLEILPIELFELTWLEELYLSSEGNFYDFDKQEPINFKSRNTLKANCISHFGKFVSLLSPFKSSKPTWENFVNLRILLLRGNKKRTEYEFRDIEPLKYLINLQQLDISDTFVRDLIPLQYLDNLRLLNISWTQVEDLTPLKNLKSLERLYAENIPLSKFDWLIKKQEKTMMKEAFDTLVKKYVGDGKTDKAFTALLEWAQENGDTKIKNAILALRNQWKENENESNMGTSSYDEINRTRARIVKAVLEIADTLGGINQPAQKQDPVSSQTKKTILFIASSPDGVAMANANRQLRSIQEALQRMRKEDFYEIKNLGFIQPSELIGEVIKNKPDFIHFFMHNDTVEGLFFENGNGNAIPFDSTKLKRLFERVTNNKKIECVVLNACNTQIHKEAVSLYVPNVVYTTDFIPDVVEPGNNDTVASLFTRKFYEGVFSDKSYTDALMEANDALLFSQMPLPPKVKKTIEELYEIAAH